MEFIGMIGLMGGVFAIIVVLTNHQSKKIETAFMDFADLNQLDFFPATGKIIKGYPTTEGNYKGRYLKLFMFTKGSGKSKKVYTAIELDCDNRQGVSLRLYREGFFSKIAKKAGMQDIEVGDKFFDDNFIIKSDNIDFPISFFDEDLKSQLNLLHKRMKGELKITHDKVYYEEMVMMMNEKTLAHFHDFADFMNVVVDRVERF